MQTKLYFTSISVLAAFTLVLAQPVNNEIPYLPSRYDGDINFGRFANNLQTSKRYGETLYEFTFETEKWQETWDPVTRTVNYDKVRALNFDFVDNNDRNFTFHWSQVGPMGYYISQYPMTPNQGWLLISTSNYVMGSESGYLLLEIDFFNTDPDNWQPIQPGIPMDTYFEIGGDEGLDFTDNTAVVLSFEQYYRFCCSPPSPTSGPRIKVADNKQFTEEYSYNALISGIFSFITNPAIKSINISNIASGKKGVWVRFHLLNQTSYFWGVDDIRFYEPFDYNIELKNFWVDYYEVNRFGESYVDWDGSGKINPYSYNSYWGIPYHTPYWTFQDIKGLRALVENVGQKEIQNVRTETELWKILPEENILIEYRKSSEIPPLQQGKWDSIDYILTGDDIISIKKEKTSTGSYKIKGFADCLESDMVFTNNYYEYPFVINENLFGYANPKYVSPHHIGHKGAGRGGPWGFEGAQSGDCTGALFHINSDSNDTRPLILRGINYFVSPDVYHYNIWRAGKTFQINGEIYARNSSTIENWFDNTDGGSNAIDKTIKVNIDSTVANSWLFIPFENIGNSGFFLPPDEADIYWVVLRAFLPSQEQGQDFRWFPNSDIYSHSSAGGIFTDLYNFPWFESSNANLSIQLVVDPYEYLSETPKGKLELNVYYKSGSYNYANGADIEFYKRFIKQ